MVVTWILHQRQGLNNEELEAPLLFDAAESCKRENNRPISWECKGGRGCGRLAWPERSATLSGSADAAGTNLLGLTAFYILSPRLHRNAAPAWCFPRPHWYWYSDVKWYPAWWSLAQAGGLRVDTTEAAHRSAELSPATATPHLLSRKRWLPHCCPALLHFLLPCYGCSLTS